MMGLVFMQNLLFAASRPAATARSLMPPFEPIYGELRSSVTTERSPAGDAAVWGGASIGPLIYGLILAILAGYRGRSTWLRRLAASLRRMNRGVSHNG
jgi:hypothetical protein